MKAAVYCTYGQPEVLRLEDHPTPAPGDDEVLIRTRAVAINPMDYHLMGGTMVLRLMTGLHRPKPTRPGADLAIEVEAIGRHVTRFQVGEAVFGVARGAFAWPETVLWEGCATGPLSTIVGRDSEVHYSLFPIRQ